jgi:hypothetical protein
MNKKNESGIIPYQNEWDIEIYRTHKTRHLESDFYLAEKTLIDAAKEGGRE